MGQDGPKMGPSWGHVGLQNRPERVQERKKATPKTRQETSSKTIEKERPRQPQRGRGGVRRRVKMASPGGLGGYLAKAK